MMNWQLAFLNISTPFPYDMRMFHVRYFHLQCHPIGLNDKIIMLSCGFIGMHTCRKVYACVSLFVVCKCACMHARTHAHTSTQTNIHWTFVSKSLLINSLAFSTASGNPITFTCGSFFDLAPILSFDGHNTVVPVSFITRSKKSVALSPPWSPATENHNSF